jgi:hypothetical protein
VGVCTNQKYYAVGRCVGNAIPEVTLVVIVLKKKPGIPRVRGLKAILGPIIPFVVDFVIFFWGGLPHIR